MPISLHHLRTGASSRWAVHEDGEWGEVDATLADLLALPLDRARAVIEAAVRDTDDQRRPGTPALMVQLELIGDRPAGRTPPDSPLVAAARAATEFIGETPELLSSSTDANIPISLGIPAITMGAGKSFGSACPARK